MAEGKKHLFSSYCIYIYENLTILSKNLTDADYIVRAGEHEIPYEQKNSSNINPLLYM